MSDIASVLSLNQPQIKDADQKKTKRDPSFCGLLDLRPSAFICG